MISARKQVTYMLRTCNADMTSRNGFTSPDSGHVNCPDWDSAAHCGHGLHGLLLGCGEGSLLDWFPDAKWLVVEIDREDIVDLNGKIKVPRGTVVFCGLREEAISKLEALAPECKTMPIVGATRTAGDNGIATAGYNGSAIAGNFGKAIAGDYGTATAGHEGTAMAGWKGMATAWRQGTAVAGDYGRATAGRQGTAVAGEGGVAIAGDSGLATAGYQGTATAGNWGHATVGVEGTAMAGVNGKISIDWWDEKTNRLRTLTGYVGEDDIEPDKPYRVDPDTGKLVLAE